MRWGSGESQGRCKRRARSVLALALLLPAPASAACYHWPVVSVTDGDSLVVEIAELPPELRRVPVRIANIDAPELRSDCLAEKALAEKARDALAELLASGPVEVCPAGWEKYGRILATVWAGQVDVGEELVRRGLARAYDGGTRDAWCW